jgi:hypothetical protein
MPIGTVSLQPIRRDLKSLPPDGFVMLRQLPYWDVLERRDGASKASMESVKRKPGQSREDTTKLSIETFQTWERAYIFKNCIVDHNITDDKGVLLDFTKPQTLKMLNPKIGMEIERYIDELNSEDDEDIEDFPSAASISLPQKTPEPVTQLEFTENS